MGCGASSSAPPATVGGNKPALGKNVMLKRVFDAMDVDKSGSVDLKEFLRLAKSKEETAMELPMMHSFMDANGDGKVTFDEWANGLEAMTSGASEEDMVKELTQMLQVVEGTIQADKSDEQKMDNLLALVSDELGGTDASAVDPDTAKMDKLLSLVDDELVAAAKAEEDDAGEAATADDQDDLDGLDEMASEMSPALAKAKEIFDALDTDGDGSLNKAELKQGLSSDPEAAALLGDDVEGAINNFDLDGDGEVTWMEFEQAFVAQQQAAA